MMAAPRSHSSIQRMDASLRLLVNTVLHGYDSYATLKLAVLLWLAKRAMRILKQVWIHRDKGFNGVRLWILARAAPLLKRVPMVEKQLASEMEKLRGDFLKDISADLTEPRAKLPAHGQSESELTELLRTRHRLDTQYWQPGKTTGAIYHGDLEYMQWIGQIAGMFAFTNPLHMKLHPSTRQMESEVIAIVLGLYNGPTGSCGAFTTGGTESILMAMKSYRDWGCAAKGITAPNVVCCTTAHAAFDKAGQYFGIDIRKAGFANDEHEIDLQQVRRLIDGNTVALVGSACQYPTGSVDDIPGLSALAQQYNVGLHVDCCLGGFLVPFMEKAGFQTRHVFDFRVKGVTTISCDPHKYGFAPKGASVLMFRDQELRHEMYSFATQWSGGIYATPTILGSRPGGVVAATWAAMMRHGEAGYVETTRKIVGATREIGAAVAAMDGVRIVGRPEVCVVAFAGESGVNCYSLCDALKQVGSWELATLQHPAAVHFALTLTSSGNARGFISDLTTAIGLLRSDPAKWSGGTAGLYGTLSQLPAAFLEESAKVYLDTMSVCTADETHTP